MSTSPPPSGASPPSKAPDGKQEPEETKVKICSGHTRPICHIAYSQILDGTFWFVTSCHDAKPMLRNGESGDWVGTFEGHRGAVYCAAFNAGATRIVTGSGDFTARVWDAVTGQSLHSWTHPHYVKSCDWLGDRIATGCFDGKARVYDPANYSADPVEVAVAQEKTAVKAVYFVEDNHHLVTAAENTVKLWDLRTRGVAKEITIDGLNVLEYTHQHSLVAAHGKSVSLFDPKTLAQTGRIDTSDDIECASLSPDGRFLAAGSKIKAKEFTVDGTELEQHRGHHGPIFHVRYSPDGANIATGAEDGMVRVWPSHQVIQRFETA
jgi:serine-threonine kinase receptor-associated protein